MLNEARERQTTYSSEKKQLLDDKVCHPSVIVALSTCVIVLLQFYGISGKGSSVVALTQIQIHVPEQTLGGIPLGLGMVMKINFLNFHVHV